MVDWLCTLAQAKSELKVPLNDTTDDQYLIDSIPMVSTRIVNFTRQRYIPYYELYKYDAYGPGIDDVYRQLDLGRPLLLPTVVVNALQQTLVLNTDYITVPQDSPGYQLQLINQTYYGWSYGFGWGTFGWIVPFAWQNAIQVTGIWGYRNNYPADGWVDSNQTLTLSIVAGQKRFKVSSTSDYDANGMSPAISAGNVLQFISDDGLTYEWCQVLAVQDDNYVLTNRAINGSSATSTGAWPNGTKVYTWSVQPEINRAALRWIGYWYTRRGAYEAVKNDLSSMRTLTYPGDMPDDVRAILEQTRDWRWGIV